MFTSLASNPGAQATAATVGGLAGGSSREAGGDPWQQAISTVVGTVAGGLAPGAAQSVIAKLGQLRSSPLQLEGKIALALKEGGIDWGELSQSVRGQMLADVKKAMNTGGELNPDAVRRLADFKTVGATPTRGMLSLDPVQITREQNLAKIGANTGNLNLQQLAQQQNRNNATLISRLNDAGGGSETLPITAGRLVQDRVSGTNAALTKAEQEAWKAAKGMPGYTQPIYPDGLNAINRALGDEALMGFMPKPITDYMAAFQTGQQPFTPQHYKNLRSLLSAELAKGGNEAAAARTAINALDSTPITPITQTGRDFGNSPVTQDVASLLRAHDAQAGEAINAVNAARGATAAKYGYQESSPLVKAALSDARSADPEKIAQSFILNGSVNDAKAVAKEVGPQGLPVIRNAIATSIKKAALNGASDETGTVSQSALNAAINKVGQEKLSLFFSPEEIAQLRATGRVATYTQVQPKGSAVNNSNSGTLMLGKTVDWLDNTLSKIPFGQSMVVDPLRNIDVSLAQRQAMNITPSLLQARQNQSVFPSLLATTPLLFQQGLLSSK